MNFEILNKKLFSLTTSENSYLKYKTSPNYTEHSIINLAGKEVFAFSYKKSHQSTTPFFIRKQSRFVPVPEHFTDVIEINYVYNGQSKHKVNGKEILLNKGDLIIIDTNTSHEAAAVGMEDIVISINVQQDFFKQHFVSLPHEPSTLSQFLFQAISESRYHNQYLIFKSESSQNLHLLFQQLLHETYFPSLYHIQIQSHFLQLILLELITSFSVEANGTNQKNEKQQLTLDILNYIDQNYLSINLSKCAQHFGYNASYFSQLVKQATGIPFKKIVQDKKLQSSLIPLVNSNISIQDIALDSGFSNLNQFYKLFKEKYNMTPAQYRGHK